MLWRWRLDYHWCPQVPHLFYLFIDSFLIPFPESHFLFPIPIHNHWKGHPFFFVFIEYVFLVSARAFLIYINEAVSHLIPFLVLRFIYVAVCTQAMSRPIAFNCRLETPSVCPCHTKGLSDWVPLANHKRGAINGRVSACSVRKLYDTFLERQQDCRRGADSSQVLQQNGLQEKGDIGTWKFMFSDISRNIPRFQVFWRLACLSWGLTLKVTNINIRRSYFEPKTWIWFLCHLLQSSNYSKVLGDWNFLLTISFFFSFCLYLNLVTY